MNYYNLSKNYDLAYKLICEGYELACFVDYVYKDDGDVFRDICKMKRFGDNDIYIGSRGVEYGGVKSYMIELRDKTEKQLLLEECERMNLEFIINLNHD